MSLKNLLIASVYLVIMCTFSTAKPIQAFCKVVWLFGIPCAEVNTSIVIKIKAMDQYLLGTVSPGRVEADHTSTDVLQVEHLVFTISPTALDLGCRVGATSLSQFWFSRLDNGTNYCDLYNVIHGSGLANAPGFAEYTNEWLCLGFGLANDCKM